MFACLVAFQFAARAGEDKIIPVAQLPAASQQLIKQHFATVKVAYAKVDTDWFDKDYEVVFTDGNKVEFRKDGQWKEISCKYGQLPAGVVPRAMADYVTKNYPGAKMLKIERDAKGYELKLDSGLELKFDLRYNLVGIDD